jgi:hypothetical protein
MGPSQPAASATTTPTPIRFAPPQAHLIAAPHAQAASKGSQAHCKQQQSRRTTGLIGDQQGQEAGREVVDEVAEKAAEAVMKRPAREARKCGAGSRYRQHRKRKEANFDAEIPDPLGHKELSAPHDRRPQSEDRSQSKQL